MHAWELGLDDEPGEGETAKYIQDTNKLDAQRFGERCYAGIWMALKPPLFYASLGLSYSTEGRQHEDGDQNWLSGREWIASGLPKFADFFLKKRFPYVSCTEVYVGTLFSRNINKVVPDRDTIDARLINRM
jgi:hypothetical protein